MKKNEIIETLLSKGCKMEDISGLKIKELRNMLDEEIKGDEGLLILDRVKETEETIIDVPVQSKEAVEELNPIKKINKIELSLSNPPVPTDKSWTQYALSLFQDDEMDGEHPRLEGLRRVAELLLGEVVEERCELISPPTVDNSERACSKASIVFADGRIYEALADACPANTQKEFAMYPTALSETRAKGRAYRAALRLKRVIAAEEACGDTKDEEIDNPNKQITIGQQTTIRLLSDRLEISIKKLLESLEISCVAKDGIIDLKSLKYSEGLIILNKLNKLRQGEQIPESLKR